MCLIVYDMYICIYFIYSFTHTYSFIHSYGRKSILLKADTRTQQHVEKVKRKTLKQISSESKCDAAVERGSGSRCRKPGTWEGNHEAWQNSGNKIIIFRIDVVLFFLWAFYTHQLINHQNTHMSISLITTPKNDELLLDYIAQTKLKNFHTKPFYNICLFI